MTPLTFGDEGAARCSRLFFCDPRRPWQGRRRAAFMFSSASLTIRGEGAA